MFDETDNLITQNDNWRDTQEDDILETSIPPTDNRESAIVMTLPPARYTALVVGKNSTSGIGLVEIYDLEPEVGSILGNISSRGFVGTDNDVLIGGLIIGPRRDERQCGVTRDGSVALCFDHLRRATGSNIRIA